jgi:phosphoglycolate phosphatase
MNAFDLVMFDLDGTLIETAPEICDAVNDTLRHFALPEVTQQQVNDWIGHGTRELLVQAMASVTGATSEAVRSAAQFPTQVAVFDKHYHLRCGTRSNLYPQVRETLVALRERGVKLAIVTNKEARFTASVLNFHQMQLLLDTVVSGDTLPTKKPNPAGIYACLALFGVPPERALFVGDSSIDVATARNAGVQVWALPYGYNMGQAIESCGPDRIIPDCSLLLN